MTTKLLEYVQSVRPAVRIAEPMVIPPPNGQTWKIDDLDALVDDEYRYELVEGELQMISPASPTTRALCSPELQRIWAPSSKVVTWRSLCCRAWVLHLSLIQKAPCVHLM